MVFGSKIDEDDSDDSQQTQIKVEVDSKGDTTTATVTKKPLVIGDTVTTTISDEVMTQTINSAVQNANIQGTAPTAELQLDSSRDASAMNVTLNTASLQILAAYEDAQLMISSSAATVVFDAQAIQAIAKQSGTSLTLKVAPISSSKLTAAQKSTAGNSTVFELAIISGGKYISNFNNGQATVTLPYKLKDKETAAGMVVWHLSDAGELTECETIYSTAKETITFTTPHFSEYMIGYVSNKTAAITDVDINPNTGAGGMDICCTVPRF